jgi:hypothetical protein
VVWRASSSSRVAPSARTTIGVDGRHLIHQLTGVGLRTAQKAWCTAPRQPRGELVQGRQRAAAEAFDGARQHNRPMTVAANPWPTQSPTSVQSGRRRGRRRHQSPPTWAGGWRLVAHRESAWDWRDRGWRSATPTPSPLLVELMHLLQSLARRRPAP